GFAVIPQGGAFRALKPIKTLDEWRDFWKPGKTDAVLGPIPFRGRELIPEEAAPEKLAPEDFRLQADGLGANVDLVGPGPAYERWKATPDYQQWLADTGRPTAAVKPFAVLSGGKPERLFATLPEALSAAAGGDAIEIRGDGPFAVPPVELGD